MGNIFILPHIGSGLTLNSARPHINWAGVIYLKVDFH